MAEYKGEARVSLTYPSGDIQLEFNNRNRGPTHWAGEWHAGNSCPMTPDQALDLRRALNEWAEKRKGGEG